MAGTKDLLIRQGETFHLVLRADIDPILYKKITGIAQEAPAQFNVPGHGIPNGWPVTVVSVKGMREINDKVGQVIVIDENTVSIPTINAADFKPYESGGYLMHKTPVSLTGHTARMSIKDKVGGIELLALNTENNRIVINQTDHTIALSISAADTSLISWAKGVYDLELVSGDAEPVVTRLLSGSVSVLREVTT